MKKTWKRQETSFDGLIGAIQQQRLLELSSMLGVILITTITAHYLFVIRSIPVTIDILLMTFLSLALVLSGLHLLASRKLISSLQSIRLIENSISKVVDSDLYLQDLDRASTEQYGRSLAQACDAAVNRLAELGGDGGLIAVDHLGNIALPFNTGGMYRGYGHVGEPPQVDIYR